MVTCKRTVTTEAAVATTISRALAARVVAEEKIHCPSLHLMLSKIRLQLKDNVHTLLYISIKEKMRWSKYANYNNSVNTKYAVYFLRGTERSDSLLFLQREASIMITAFGLSSAQARALLLFVGTPARGPDFRELIFFLVASFWICADNSMDKTRMF